VGDRAVPAFDRVYAAYRWSFALAALGTGLWLPLNAVYLVDERDVTATQLAAYYVALAGAAIVANLTVAARVDSGRVFRVFVAAGILQMLGIVGLLTPGPPTETLLAGAVSGVGNGLFFASQGVILLRVFGADALPTVYGRQYRLINLYMLVGAVALSSLVQTASRTGYLVAFSVNAASYLIHVLNVAGPVRWLSGATATAGATGGAPGMAAPGARTSASASPYRDTGFRWLLILQTVVVAVGLAQLDSAVPVLFRQVLELPLWAVSLLLVVNPVVVVAVQGRVVPVVERVGEIEALRRALLLWAVAVVPSALAMLAGAELWVGLAALVAYGAIFALAEVWVSPSIQPLVVKLAPPERVGSYSAATSLMYSIGLLAGPAGGLFVYARADAAGYWAFIAGGLAVGGLAVSKLDGSVRQLGSAARQGPGPGEAGTGRQPGDPATLVAE
jgi:Major Facilitator Superfamily